MKIIKKSEVVHVDKPEGTKVDYYLRDEYEVHYNEQVSGSTQTWHHHNIILESIFVIEGELTAKWKIGTKEFSQIVKAGDLVETENTSHTFTNHTDKIARFIVIKQILSGQNKTELLKTDKIVD